MHTRIYLTPADHGRALSWDEFAAADAEEGYRYEMIEGRLFVSPVPDMPHDDLKEWLEAAFRLRRERPDILCRISGAARVFLPEGAEGVTAPEPDIACYADYPKGRPCGGGTGEPSPRFSWSRSSPKTIRRKTSSATAGSISRWRASANTGSSTRSRTRTGPR